MKMIAIIYLAWVTLLSVVTFCIYGWDKRQSKLDGWRTPEKKLHWLSVLGGWPGALAGQKHFRHKTQKLSFEIVTWASAALHLAIFGLIVYAWLF